MVARHDYVPLTPTDPLEGNADDSAYPPPFRIDHRFDLPSLLFPSLTRGRSRIRIGLLITLFSVSSILTFHSLRSYSSSPDHGPLHPEQNPYFHTGDIWKHNDAVATRLDRCASLGLLRNTSLPIPANESLSNTVEEALIAEGCGTNETTIIILASLWAAEAFSGSSTAGESIYAQSVISTLNALNYSYVFSSLGWYNPDMRKSVELWDKHRWNVRAVLADPTQVDACWRIEDQRCLKTQGNPEGIEAWRLLSFWYWDDPGNPLGAKFTLSPSPRNDNHFLSFSIEPTCRRLPFTPHAARALPPRAYLLAKQVHYLDDTPAFSWTLPFLAGLQKELRISVVGGMVDDDEVTTKALEGVGITNLGRLGKIEFYEELGRSFVFLGVGRPRISPSPWDALCMGLPFINPILEWDPEDPTNRTKWHTQQWWMTDLQPPYVYSVFAHDLTALRSAVEEALINPIDSWIPDYMEFSYVAGRMAEVVENDWRGVAAKILQERMESGNGEASHVATADEADGLR